MHHLPRPLIVLTGRKRLRAAEADAALVQIAVAVAIAVVDAVAVVNKDHRLPAQQTLSLLPTTRSPPRMGKNGRLCLLRLQGVALTAPDKVVVVVLVEVLVLMLMLPGQES